MEEVLAVEEAIVESDVAEEEVGLFEIEISTPYVIILYVNLKTERSARTF